MNWNLINLPPTEWSKKDWQDAYAQYCQHNMFGPKTKKEYYDMVLERYKIQGPVPQEILDKWSAGRRAAAQWAKKCGCDMNGRMLSDVVIPRENINDLADRLDVVEKNHDNLKKAYSAHVMKINRNLPNMK